MSNTPVREVPYRDTLVTEDGESFECIVFKKQGAHLHVQIDDEKAGEDNSKVLVLEMHQ